MVRLTVKFSNQQIAQKFTLWKVFGDFQTHFKHIFWIESFYENQSTLFSIHLDCISNMPLNKKQV